jgi:glycosyltransferase involved in cell wall biosynthesis
MVKNEAAVIERCISSFRGHVDYVFLCDTGSSDATTYLARHAWKTAESTTMFIDDRVRFENFEQARNQCKKHMEEELARRGLEEVIGYVLLADADFTMVTRTDGGGERRLEPLFDVNMIQIHAGVSGHPHNALHMLVRYSVFKERCRYRMWTHEFLDCSEAARGSSNASVAGVPTYGHHSSFYYVDHADGVSRPEKLSRDITLLQKWLRHQKNETDLRPRALYYLARAQEDSGQFKEALKTYALHDAEQSYTNYQFYSLYRQALIKLHLRNQNRLSVPFDEVERAFLLAHAHYDGYFRAEPLYHLARLHRLEQNGNSSGAISQCVIYASAAVHAPPVNHDRMPLFLDVYVYEWAAQEELAYCLSLLGNTAAHRRQVQRLYRDILDRNPATLDAASRKRIESAVEF